MLKDLLALIDDALSLQGRALRLGPKAELAGAIPELDSVGVMAVVSAAEERWGITVLDEEIDSAVFETVASLQAFLERKIAQR